MKARLAVLLLASALAGCGSLGGMVSSQEPYWLKDGGPRFPSAAESLLLYQAYVWNLGAAEWPKEYQLVREAVAHDRRLFQRIRQAMAAAAPAAPYAERMRAPQLLEQCERDAQDDAALKALVGVLRDELVERRRLEERLREENRRADALEQKLGQIKAIELQLLERNRPSGARKP